MDKREEAERLLVVIEVRRDGQDRCPPISGRQTQPHANQLVTAMSQLLDDAPADWADGIRVTVS
jgi:hypothetical protein